MPSNTTYNPTHINDFEKTKLNFNGQGVTSSISAGTTTNIDYLLTDDCLITGVELISNNGNYGDYIIMQVVDTTGIAGYPPNTVLEQIGTNWYLPPTADTQFEIVYPAKIITGLTLRIIYKSTALLGTTFIAINYKLHKCMI